MNAIQHVRHVLREEMQLIITVIPVITHIIIQCMISKVTVHINLSSITWIAQINVIKDAIKRIEE